MAMSFSIVNFLRAFVSMLVATFGTIATSPLVEVIFNLMEDGMTKYVAIMVWWLILFFVVFITSHSIMFKVKIPNRQ